VFTINETWRTKEALWPLIVGGFLLTILTLVGVEYHFFMREFIEEHDGTVINKSYPIQETPIEADADTIKKLLKLKELIDTCQAERATYKVLFETCRYKRTQDNVN
jgi:hypothetical protein